MKRVLFLPFLQISSGHHQAAEALIEAIQHDNDSIICDKVDILDYTYGKIETVISTIYLKWIHFFPSTYSWLYRKSVYTNMNKPKNFRLYECLFLHAMLKLLREMNPHLIICTHALPSYMVNKLKQQKKISIPVINVYTDFFIHKFWGIQHINYHFVAHEKMSAYLQINGVNKNQIVLTGIPVHSKINNRKRNYISKKNLTGLILGGSLGVGNIQKLLRSISKDDTVNYFILCGKNRRLYKKLQQLNLANIKPLPYIDSRESMNELYSNCDFVITKPGGVTISECITKGLPIFIHQTLPGQEEINLKNLIELGIVFPLLDWDKKEDISTQIVQCLTSTETMTKYFYNCNKYKKTLSENTPLTIIKRLLS